MNVSDVRVLRAVVQWSGRSLIFAAALTVMTAQLFCVPAQAADDDDDKGGRSDSRPTTSSVATWPPMSVDWPPMIPDDVDGDAVPIVIAGTPPAGALTSPDTGSR